MKCFKKLLLFINECRLAFIDEQEVIYCVKCFYEFSIFRCEREANTVKERKVAISFILIEGNAQPFRVAMAIKCVRKRHFNLIAFKSQAQNTLIDH